jgi:hypothetical protein
VKVLRWLADHWYLALVFLGALAGFLMARKRDQSPIQTTRAELEAIRAGAEAREKQAEIGAEQARRHVESKYREELLRLDQAQADEARELRDDPVALAKFLVRAGHRSRD